jgi:hypothetical protein
MRREFGTTRLPTGTIRHPWQALEGTYAAALEFLMGFVAHGAGHWRETPLDEQRTLTRLTTLPRVCAALESHEAVSQDPDALTDAIEEAVKAAAQALPDPHRSAALELLGYTSGSRGKGKTQREILAAKLLRRSDRWLRAPSREYGGLAPRMWLLSSVAHELAATPDRPGDALASVSDQSHIARFEFGTELPSSVPPHAADPTSPAPDDANGDLADTDNAKIWPSFPYERVCQQMGAARARIRILVTWLPDTAPFIAGIADAVHNGASIEIIIQHPRSAALAERLATLGITDPHYGYYHAVKLFADLRNVISVAIPGQFAVRTYEATPLMSLYATEERLWSGFYWPDRYSLQGPQVEVSTRGSHLGRVASEYFEAVWSSATPLAAEDLAPEK